MTEVRISRTFGTLYNIHDTKWIRRLTLLRYDIYYMSINIKKRQVPKSSQTPIKSGTKFILCMYDQFMPGSINCRYMILCTFLSIST